MTTPASFNLQTLDYSRLLLSDRVSRAPYGLAIYPLSDINNKLAINVTGTTINIRYTTTTITISSVNYVNKTAEQVALEINSLALPIKAKALIKDTVLFSGDLFIYNESTFFSIPEGFRPVDRLTENGIIIRTKKYTVKHKNLANFRILSPYSQSVLLPWYPLITNGQFVQKYRSNLYHYGIPEFDNQTWSVKYGKPFKDVISGPVRQLSANSYKVSRSPIFWNGENISLYNNDVLINNSIIEDVDIQNGIIYFSPNIGNVNITSVDYTYLEKNFEYKGININAHFSQNPNLIDKFVLLYAKPLEGSDYFRNKKTIYHIVASSIEEGIANIQATDTDVPSIIIGGYSIGQVITSDRIKVFDTRSLGGGLISNEGPISPLQQYRYGYIDTKKPTRSPIEATYKESASFWDVGNWDGEIYPGAAAITISLPESLRNKMSKKEIAERASKFIAAGVYPVIEYYPDAIPAVTGKSTQISLLMNGGLTESSNGNSGVAWMRGELELPGDSTTGQWPTNLAYAPVVYRADGTGVLMSTPMESVYQTYLKSTPIAGIQYYSRSVTKITGSNNDEIVYTPWQKTTIEDRRPVPAGWLTKGYVDFSKSPNTLEIKNIKVNSPYRLDFTGQFANQLEVEIENIHKAISGKTKEQIIQDPFGEELVIAPIEYTYLDLETKQLSNCGDYFGANPAFNYLFDMIDSSLEKPYSGAIDKIGKQVVNSVTGVGGLKSFLFYSVGNGYQAYEDLSQTGLDFRDSLIQLSKYTYWKGKTAGISDPYYNLGVDYIINIVNSINNISGYYYPKTYRTELSDSIASPIQFIPEPHVFPATSGYSEAEVNEEYNKDFDYLYMNPAICSTALAVYDYSSFGAINLSTSLNKARTAASAALNRFTQAVNGTRTYSGVPVVQSWYLPYNRYGKYLGSITRQFIDSYEYLHTSQVNGINVGFNNLAGMDVDTLDWYFSGIETMLKVAYSGVSENVLRNGVMEPEMADTLYSYGWYVVNRDKHIEYRDSYTGMSGVGANYKPEFSGLFKTGLYMIVKGMTTQYASMLEAPIVNGEPGPFDPAVPTKIIDTLSIGCKIDKATYLPLAQAVFNTITGNYSVNGMYWADPLKSIKNAGNEDIMGTKWVNLYKAL